MKRFALIILTLTLVVNVLTAQDLERLFKAAVNTETVDRNCKGAIEQYKKVAAGSNRALAAQALLRMADCYRRLGDDEARKIYQRLVNEFSDQTQAAETARARLGTTTMDAEIVVRKLTNERMSAEERTVVTGGWNLVDLPQTMDPRRDGGWVEGQALSPDAKRVAYLWYNLADNIYEVRLVDARPGAKPRVLVANPEFGYYRISGWSRDGESILALILSGGNTSQLAWISAVDGKVRTLKSMDWRSPGGARLSPDGRFIAYDVLAERDTLEREIRVLAADGSSDTVLIRATSNNNQPIWTRDGKRILFVSNRSGSFSLYAVPVREGQAEGPEELVKSDTGLMGPIGFTRSGSLLYGQSRSDQNVFVVELDPAAGNIKGNPLRIADRYVGSNAHPAWSPDGRSIAYFSRRTGSPDISSPSTLIVRNVDSGQERIIQGTFTYPGRPMWTPDGRSVIVLSRNNQNHACFYRVDVNAGGVRELVNLHGFTAPWTALSPDGKTAYAWAPEGAGVLAAFDLETGTRRDVYTQQNRGNGPLAISPDGRRIAVVDKQPAGLYSVDVAGGGSREVFAGLQEGSIVAIAWSPDSRWIYFVRADDRSMRDARDSQLWRAPAEGGAPQYTGLTATTMWMIHVGPDGNKLVFGGGAAVKNEVWALDHLETAWSARRN